MPLTRRPQWSLLYVYAYDLDWTFWWFERAYWRYRVLYPLLRVVRRWRR